LIYIEAGRVEAKEVVRECGVAKVKLVAKKFCSGVCFVVAE
jgi:hypothetical protein